MIAHPLIHADEHVIVLGYIHARGYGRRLWITEPDKRGLDEIDEALRLVYSTPDMVGFLRLMELRDRCKRDPDLLKCFIFHALGRWWFLPPGFVLDFYSTPRIVWFWYPPRSGLGDEAAGTHDMLCRFARLFGISRVEADRAFRQVMQLYSLSFARKKWMSVAAYSLITPPGDGTPGRRERRAMRKRGDDWREYRDLVVACNPIV